MAYTCSECTYLCPEKEYCSSSGRFYCEKDYEYHFADEIECRRYCRAYSRDDRVSKSLREYSINCQQNGCYITTILCDVMGMPDDNIFLNTLRMFRNNKMKTNELFKPLLVEYDIIGPIIAKSIKDDPRREMICQNLFNLVIYKMIPLIINDTKKTDLEAIKLYMDMTNILKEGYNISVSITENEINNASITKSGHGRYVKKLD